MTVEIEFCEPPQNPRGKGNSKWREVAATLSARPGEWAKIATRGSKQSAINLAANMRRGYGVWAPAGSFEVTVRGCDVYARYIGGAQ